ncbi:ribosomal protein S1 [Rubidibacter lacunae KORDI 51-2]|uniref:Ribosomal protein S1 n=1 Tax=Rubidibacter lacunae KORDI 51-2 TaxID=582515 RepID=U5DHN5_9CHRO|nr:ribosomal protein S1 [Rubidibacter lacunae KORDI 51-2]
MTSESPAPESSAPKIRLIKVKPRTTEVPDATAPEATPAATSGKAPEGAASQPAEVVPTTTPASQSEVIKAVVTEVASDRVEAPQATPSKSSGTKSKKTRKPGPEAAAFSMEDFEAALADYDYQSSKGQVVSGKVFEYDAEGAYVDIGGKSPGIIPPREAAIVTFAELSEVLPLGEVVECVVIGDQDAEGRVKLSRKQLLIREAWEALVEQKEAGKLVDLVINGVNRGGVTGEINGLRGFVPRSHLIGGQKMEELIGQTIEAAIVEVDPDRKKLVLSQREAARASIASKLVPGSLIEGTVVNLKPYGVFVDLGGITGLLHVKQMSGKRVDALSSVVQLNQPIKVVIKEIDEWEGRISLSTRELESYPGELLEKFENVMANAEERIEKYAEQQATAEKKPPPRKRSE